MKQLPHDTLITTQAAVSSHNRFIFGDAVEGDSLENTEYLIHTTYPMFICRLMWEDDIPFANPASSELESFMSVDEEKENGLVYICNFHLKFFDFRFMSLDAKPTIGEIQDVCDEAVQSYQRLRQAYATVQEKSTETRKLFVVQSVQGNPLDTAREVEKLLYLTREITQHKLSVETLDKKLLEVMSQGDSQVFTESQLALVGEPESRQCLIERAHHVIAYPEIYSTDGNLQKLELWAIPFTCLRAQGGIWWYFPKLEKVKTLLAEALAIPESALMYLSPTWFTVEMLNQHSCQNAVHLINAMQAQCDLAPYEMDSARAEYESANQNLSPQSVMAWIPFVVLKDVLDPETVHAMAYRILQKIQGNLHEAIREEMEYGEAEFFAPMPWWDALQEGIYVWNRKRLSMAYAFLSATIGIKLEVVAHYHPELCCYIIDFVRPDNWEVLSRVKWMLVPDLAPDRQAAWNSLVECIQELDIPLLENTSSLH